MSAPSSSDAVAQRSPFLSPRRHQYHHLQQVQENPSSSSLARPGSGASAWSAAPTAFDKRASDNAASTRVVTASRSSASPSQMSNAHSDYTEKETGVRTLPPWVLSPHDEEEDPASGLPLDPKTPGLARPAQRNFMPAPKAGTVAGRHYDHMREQHCVTISNLNEHASRWQNFARTSRYGAPGYADGSEYVSPQWLKDNLPDLEEPWQPAKLEASDGLSRRKTRLQAFQRVLMRSPYVPVVVRLTVLVFSVLALGLASSIFRHASENSCPRGSSTWLAIIVDAVAIVYTIYITWDEYTSRPLGLRSARSKMRLIFLDLGFIVFDSANLSLAFEALTDEQWACKTSELQGMCSKNDGICERQKALVGTLLIALVAWISTFAISTFRVVERVVGR